MKTACGTSKWRKSYENCSWPTKRIEYGKLLHILPCPRRASGRRRAWLKIRFWSCRLTTQPLLRRPAAAGLLGVRYTRLAHSTHPHCARRRILAFGSDPLFSSRATSAAGNVSCNTKRQYLGFPARPGLRPSGAFV